LRQSDLITSY